MRFHYLTGIGIEDSLTGYTYTNQRDITNLLNQINEESENNKKQYWDLRMLILDADTIDELRTRIYKEITD
jgi:hypothetical protein